MLTEICYPEYLPAIEACTIFSLKAIYCGSQDSAEELAGHAKTTVDAYFEGSLKGRSLDDLLEREDINAVIIALPILVQPQAIKKAIKARKHVLSEKPIAGDVDTARALIRWYEEQNCEELWSVGENFRFFEPLAFGAEQLGKMRGEIVTFSVKMYDLMDENDDQTERYKGCRGGYLLGGGIPFVAGLRYLLGAAGLDITHVAAFTSLLKQHLAPSDTIHATIQISNGNSGTFSLSFGAEYKYAFEIQVVTEKGAVIVKPSGIMMTTRDNRKGQTFSFKPCKGVRQEVTAFAQSIKNGRVDKRGTPEQALLDLKVLQAMVQSSEEAGKVKVV